jgi:hypothetical protein
MKKKRIDYRGTDNHIGEIMEGSQACLRKENKIISRLKRTTFSTLYNTHIREWIQEEVDPTLDLKY